MDSDTCNEIVQALNTVISVLQTGAVLSVDKLDTHTKRMPISGKGERGAWSGLSHPN